MIKSLSIVIPFFNEAKRVNVSLKKIKKFIDRSKFKKIEVNFVNDGSTDESPQIINKFIKKENKKNIKYRLFDLVANEGKGAAVKKGVLKSNCTWILTSDIDLSVDLNQIIIWERKKLIVSKHKIYFGSRELKNSVVKSKFYRKFLGYFFRLFTLLFFGIDLKDSQCGFKLYEKSVAKYIFKNLKTNGFEHDIEIVTLAKNKNFKIIELPVHWSHVSGSKLNVFFDPIKMLFGIIKIRLKYL